MSQDIFDLAFPTHSEPRRFETKARKNGEILREKKLLNPHKTYV